ncbi:hypothetical protein [Clostridium sp.]|uniref:transposase-like zinc-binding domain-containing protein n=1 Tax=Clostridium sp. TaxID=1506 RepID=UPI00261F8D5A|nr:hypothetical protein [Clostridium sp.]
MKIEFSDINKHLDNLNEKDLLDTIDIIKCPYCNNKNFIKNGFYTGIQRYKCKSIKCNKTFSKKTHTLNYYSKKPPSIWMKYLYLMNLGYSLRDCSSILNISLSTCFFWRHKILLSEKKKTTPITLKEYIEVNNIVIKENRKGTKNLTSLERPKIFIFSGIDINKEIYSKVLYKNSTNLYSLTKIMYKFIDKGAYISNFGNNIISAFTKNHNKHLKKPKKLEHLSLTFNNSPSYSKGVLFHVHKDYISNFSINIFNWLRRFKGVATKYIENYLSWYILDFKESYNLKDLNSVTLFKNLFIYRSFIKISIIKNTKPLHL